MEHSISYRLSTCYSTKGSKNIICCYFCILFGGWILSINVGRYYTRTDVDLYIHWTLGWSNGFPSFCHLLIFFPFRNNAVPYFEHRCTIGYGVMCQTCIWFNGLNYAFAKSKFSLMPPFMQAGIRTTSEREKYQYVQWSPKPLRHPWIPQKVWWFNRSITQGRKTHIESLLWGPPKASTSVATIIAQCTLMVDKMRNEEDTEWLRLRHAVYNRVNLLRGDRRPTIVYPFCNTIMRVHHLLISATNYLGDLCAPVLTRSD